MRVADLLERLRQLDAGLCALQQVARERWHFVDPLRRYPESEREVGVRVTVDGEHLMSRARKEPSHRPGDGRLARASFAGYCKLHARTHPTGRCRRAGRLPSRVQISSTRRTSAAWSCPQTRSSTSGSTARMPIAIG